jgi:hypothetical protein
MKRSDWNLLVLAAAGGQPLQPVQFQKVLFLLGKDFPDVVGGESYYHFEPYNYGAFDANVYSDAEALEGQSLTTISQTYGGWKQYAAAPAGLAKARELEQQAPSHVVGHIKNLVAWAKGLSFNELVRAVYEAHPETKANSIFKG